MGKTQKKAKEKDPAADEEEANADIASNSQGSSSSGKKVDDRRRRLVQIADEEEVSSRSSAAPTQAVVSAIIRQKRDHTEGEPVKKMKIVEKKPKKAGGSVNLKDLYLSVRSIAVMLRGNLATRDQAIPDYAFRAMGNLMVKCPKYKFLKDAFRAMTDDEFSEFIDHGIRGSNGSLSSGLCNQLKMFHQKLHQMLTGGAYFKEATKAIQMVFAYDGLEPYWEYMPRQRSQNDNLADWQKSFFLDRDWMVSPYYEVLTINIVY